MWSYNWAFLQNEWIKNVETEKAQLSAKDQKHKGKPNY